MEQFDLNYIENQLNVLLGTDVDDITYIDFIKKMSWILCISALPKLISHSNKQSDYNLVRSAMNEHSINSTKPNLDILKAVISTEKKISPSVFDTETYLLYDYTFNMGPTSKIDLVEVLDLVLDGEALTNVYEDRALIYQWLMNDVLDAVMKNNFPNKIYSLGILVPTQEFLDSLINRT